MLYKRSWKVVWLRPKRMWGWKGKIEGNFNSKSCFFLHCYIRFRKTHVFSSPWSSRKKIHCLSVVEAPNVSPAEGLHVMRGQTLSSIKFWKIKSRRILENDLVSRKLITRSYLITNSNLIFRPSYYHRLVYKLINRCFTLPRRRAQNNIVLHADCWCRQSSMIVFLEKKGMSSIII